MLMLIFIIIISILFLILGFVIYFKSWFSKKDNISYLATLAKDFSTLIIPFVIAVVGWQVQSVIQAQNGSREYVQIAVSILLDGDVDKELKSWAVDLLKKNSPVVLPEALETKLKNGEVNFPSLLLRASSFDLGKDFSFSSSSFINLISPSSSHNSMFSTLSNSNPE